MDRCSLSFAQQRLWFLQQLEPDDTSYNIGQAVRLKGALDVGALQRALEAMVDRHEVLRVRFDVEEGGQPAQVIETSLDVPLQIENLTRSPGSKREEAVQRRAREEGSRPFDLAQGPLFRAKLLRLGEEEHVLLVSMHHIVSDGWSMGVFWRELATLYNAFCEGKSSPLPELPIQYTDYAIWQREWLQGEELETQLNYWKRQLADVPALELPTDRPRPAVQTHRGARQSLTLSKSLTKALRELSRQEGATLFMTLLATFQLLLSRYSGQEDIAVGSPIAGRNRAEIEGLIGFFVNTLVLRTDLSGDPTFRELLGRVREVALGAYEHQELPFEKLVEELKPERDLSRTPLFQVFLNMSDAGETAIELSGLTVEPTPSPEVSSKFDLTLYVTEPRECLHLTLAYNTDLFERDTTRQVLSHFRILVEGIVANPEQRLSRFPLSIEAGPRRSSLRRSLLRPDNASFVYFPKQAIEQSIPQRFEQQAQAYPDALAIKTERYVWTYEELNRAANRVARTILARYRRGGGERIALLFDHDAPMMVAAVLGVLKSGNAYVPIDPANPEERISYLLSDSQVGALVTHGAHLELVHALVGNGVPVIDIDEIDTDERGDDLGLEIPSRALAYILYTSGSTGRPKGVMQNHRNVLQHVRNYTNNLRVGPDDRLTLISSYDFDAAVMDIFGALLNGATLVPIAVKNGGLATLVKQVAGHGITVYHSTPTVYRYFVSALAEEDQFPKLRLVILGGEEANRRDFELYKRHFSEGCLFVNGLGPTEATVALQHFMNQQTENARDSVAVGYPVEDAEVLLLNEAGEEIGICGEIAIKSPHVALGYWQKPEMTRAAFLPDPEGGDRRLYRTGDLGRMLPDGSIEWRGRKDLQVKIRGHRIEPREVEATLAEHPAVRQVVVVARAEDGPGEEKRLVAYYVPTARRRAPTLSELRSFLKEKLPEYMIPAAFVVLDALPLTPNGKVDWQALAAPDSSSFRAENVYAAPRTPVEEALVGIFEEVLGLERVGAHDDFFELGGHSLLATQFVSRVREAFQVELPLRSLFEEPTIAGLAERIEVAQEANLALPMAILSTLSSDDLDEERL